MKRPLTVLLVTPSAEFQSSVTYFLQRQLGVEAASNARSGHEAIELLGKRPSDLLILDQALPDTDAFEVSAVARSLPDPPRVVLITKDDARSLLDQPKRISTGVVGDASLRQDLPPASGNQRDDWAPKPTARPR